MAEGESLRVVYGEALVEPDAKDSKAAVMDTDLAHATMANTFVAKYPDRLFNSGIAGVNIVYGATGFVHSGSLLSVSTFALPGVGRAYRQTRSSASYVNASMEFGFSCSGLCVGEDGGSH